MDTSIVFRKTGKGIEEIDTRRHGLSMALRRALILVDGTSDVAKIIEKGAGVSDAVNSLRELERGGFISASGGGALSSSVAVGGDIKERLIEVARDILGPKDAEKIIAKLERAPATKDGLEETLNMCKKLVKLTIDEKKAKQLEARCHEILQNL